MRLARQLEENSLLFREFLTVFENGGFSYYIYHNNVISTFPTETRLVRICNNDPGSTVFSNAFSSYFEIVLECGGSGTASTAASFLPSDQTITLSVTGETENWVCVFDLIVS